MHKITRPAKTLWRDCHVKRRLRCNEFLPAIHIDRKGKSRSSPPSPPHSQGKNAGLPVGSVANASGLPAGPSVSALAGLVAASVAVPVASHLVGLAAGPQAGLASGRATAPATGWWRSLALAAMACRTLHRPNMFSQSGVFVGCYMLRRS